MSRTLLFFLVCITSFAWGQETFPVNGVLDERPVYHAFTNARIHVSPGNTIDSATLLVLNGRVESVGKNLALPAGTVKHDCSGLSIYPSFIDLDAGYEVNNRKRGEKPTPSQVNTATNWNPAIHPEFIYEPSFPVQKKVREDWLAGGIGVVNVHQRDGIMRGSAALFHLGLDNANEALIQIQSSHHLSLNKGSSTFDYPSSHMGAIALFRQTLYDAEWYQGQQGRKEVNRSLATLSEVRMGAQPLIFELNHPLTYRNVFDLKEEFGLPLIMKGTGEEYRVRDFLPAGTVIIEPLDFPSAYDVEEPYDARMVNLEQLKHWEAAPFNMRLLLDQGIKVALSRDTLKSHKTFLKNLFEVSETGVSHDQLLASLTSIPAEVLQSSEIGSLESGKWANFFLSTKDLNEAPLKVVEHWNKGVRVFESEIPDESFVGNYNLVIEGEDYLLDITSVSEKGVKASAQRKSDDQKLNAKVTKERELVSIMMSSDDQGVWFRLSGKLSLAGTLLDGRGIDSTGTWVSWAAVKDRVGGKENKKLEAKPNSAITMPEIWHPNRAYGWDSLNTENTFVITNAVVWTCADTGKLEQADIWVENGKIKRVGSGFLYPTDLKRIDAKGRHVTPGLIDEHSHIAIRGGVNEGAQASSAEVRIEDSVDPWSIHIYRHLAGGVTAAQLLHGSANPIGGQSALVKLKWGGSAEDMLIDNTDGFIKFALGENVKRSNSRNPSVRFPLTRMGVEQSYVDAFTRAQEYQAQQKPVIPLKGVKTVKSPSANVRRDLQLDALVEILNKKRFITCHSYVQSEILMLMNVADSFGFNVNTFTHILEGYKVAPQMVEHGVAGSTFSDWWAYKFEVNDAIPYNAALLTKVGVNTAINSDDAEMGRRLNQEAAKTMKYGGMTEEQALNMVTINPAKILHLDDRIGSIEEGKDADLVMWSDNPLSVYSRAEITFIEGVRYFDLSEQDRLVGEMAAERNRIVKKMIADKSEKKRPVSATKEKEYHCDTIIEDYINE